jgi:hypothetical protein
VRETVKQIMELRRQQDVLLRELLVCDKLAEQGVNPTDGFTLAFREECLGPEYQAALEKWRKYPCHLAIDNKHCPDWVKWHHGRVQECGPWYNVVGLKDGQEIVLRHPIPGANYLDLYDLK